MSIILFKLRVTTCPKNRQQIRETNLTKSLLNNLGSTHNQLLSFFLFLACTYLGNLKEFLEIKLYWSFISLNKFVECKWGQVTDSDLYETERTFYMYATKELPTTLRSVIDIVNRKTLAFWTELH